MRHHVKAEPRELRREWQPTPVFLPGKFHGQRNLTGYSPQGCKENEFCFVFFLLHFMLKEGANLIVLHKYKG